MHTYFSSVLSKRRFVLKNVPATVTRSVFRSPHPRQAKEIKPKNEIFFFFTPPPLFLIFLLVAVSPPRCCVSPGFVPPKVFLATVVLVGGRGMESGGRAAL